MSQAGILQGEVSDLMVMDQWQASLMRTLAKLQLAQDAGARAAVEGKFDMGDLDEGAPAPADAAAQEQPARGAAPPAPAAAEEPADGPAARQQAQRRGTGAGAGAGRKAKPKRRRQ